MLDEKAVRQFFLELYEGGKNFRPEESQEILHAKKLSDSRECCGIYLFYKHLWLEEEDKGQNIVQRSGLIAVSMMKQTLWTMNYEGCYEGAEEIYDLGNALLLETLPMEGNFGRCEISGNKENGRLIYQIEVKGKFQLFEIKILIMKNDQCRQTVFNFTYRGRALVNLSA